ncbi:MAG: outer membrane beta-barrel protein [Acidobacteriota bacterium]|nr:outer membrane beta-barrel protein [Acidobacteriota bacterium]
MKKCLAFLIMTAAVVSLASAQAPTSRWPFEIGIYGALTDGANTWTETWGRSWYKYNLSEVEEWSDIEAAYKISLGAGAFATWYFTPHFGIQIGAATQTTTTPTTSYLEFAWMWSDEVDNLKSRTWEGTGRITSTPFSLNLVYRLGEDSIKGVFSAGVSLFQNTYQANSNLGYGVDQITYVYEDPYLYIYQSVDVLPLEIKIPKQSWTQIGANVGAGIDVEMSPKTSLRFDVRYFYCPVKTLLWEITQKSYDGIFFNKINDYPFGQTEIDYIASLGRAIDFDVNPSFFQVSVAFVLRFGAVIPD